MQRLVDCEQVHAHNSQLVELLLQHRQQLMVHAAALCVICARRCRRYTPFAALHRRQLCDALTS
eukprot:6183476-Pleurochrysis_carterae.AAC.8